MVEINSNNKLITAALSASLLIAMLFLAMLAFPWNKINWGKINFSQDRTIVVTGQASSDTTNQKASFNIGVNALNEDKQKAIDEVNQKSNEIVDAIKKFGIPAEDIKTQNLSIFQDEQYYTEGGIQKSRKGQWRVSNSVDVTLKDASKEKVQQFTDIVGKTNASNVYGPNFMVDSDKALEIENNLMAKAIEDARKKADAVAKANKLKVGQILTVVEGGSGGGVIYPMFDRGMGGGGAGSVVEPGTSKISKSVTVTFELM